MKIIISLSLFLFLAILNCNMVASASGMQGQSVSAATGTAGYHALVIGNNEYRAMPKLKTAEADAREVAALLKGAYGFEARLLLNATRQQIISALYTYRQALGPDANLLIYYAGHGLNDRQAEKAYWLPVDAARDDDSNWISADDITTRLRAIPARHILVISDSCYSGTLTRGLGDALPPPNAREQFIRRMMAGRSRTLMASGGDEPVADGGRGNLHSVFASALLKGLRAMDRERFTAAELFRYYIEEPVAGLAQQTPEYNPIRNSGHEGGDFVFFRKTEGGKKAEVTITAPPAPTGVDPAAIELTYWDSIKNSTDPEDYRGYLAKYPNGQFADIARRRSNINRVNNDTPRHPSENVTEPSGGTARAYALFQQKQYAEAARVAKAAAAAKPSDSEAWKIAGFAEFGLKQYAEAAADLQRALDLQRTAGAEDPNTAEVLGKSYALAEQYDRALPLLVAATTRAGAKPDAETFYYRGLSEYRMKKTDDAVRSFEAAVETDPKNSVALFYLGRISYERGQPDAAISALNRATTIDARFTEGWRLLTVAYLLRAGQAGGQGLKASADYLSAVRTSDALVKLSADESAMTLSGQALIGAQQFPRAAAVLERAAANPNAGGTTLYLLGVAHSRAKNFPKAIAALERAAAKSPEDVNVYRELGYALEVSKQYAKALAAYERGAQLDPADAYLKEAAERVRPFAR